jgi:hypothetical protein
VRRLDFEQSFAFVRAPPQQFEIFSREDRCCETAIEAFQTRGIVTAEIG